MFNKKPCPFCGSDDLELTLAAPDEDGETPVAMTCRECGAVGPLVYVASESTPGEMLTQACMDWDGRSAETIMSAMLDSAAENALGIGQPAESES